MKLLFSMLFAAASLGLSAAPELSDMPVGTDRAWLIKGRGEVEAKLNRGPAGGRKDVASFSYDFTRCPDRRNSFVRVELGQELAGMPQEFMLELRSDAPERELPLAVWIHDRSGEVYLMRFKLKGEGWQTVRVPMMRAAAWKSGDGNGKPDLPLRFAGILLDMPGENAKGVLEIGTITVKSDLEPVEVTGYPALEKYFSGGRRPVLKLNLSSRNKFPLSDYGYTLKAVDLYSGKTVLEKSGSFKGMQRFPEEVELDVPYGLIQVEYTVTRGDVRPIYFKGSFSHFMPEKLSEEPAVRAWEYEYSPLGGVFGSLSPGDANVYGAGWIRFEHPNWRDNETAPGRYDFAGMKAKMQPFIDANVRPVILQCLYHYPEFPELTDPNRFPIGYGRHFQREAAALRGVTRHFELGNEDNGHTKFLYTEVARHAAAGIRSQQPLAVLANSGTAHIDYNWLEFQRSRGLLELLDVLCVHPYTNNSTPSQEVGPEKGKIYGKLTQLNDIVDAAGGMKLLWSTEYGWPNSSRPGGEHDRADLYVREMLIGDMAGLEINGLYTWDRDYGIVGRPSGVSIQTFARMREGRRLAGFYREGDIYVAVYERDGNATAAVWTPEAGTRPNPVRGGAYFDLFGNPQKENEVKISQSPVYVRNAEKSVLDRARANTVKIARQRLEKNTRRPADNGGGAGLIGGLEAWSRGQGAISQQEQTVIARRLDHALAQARLDGSLPASKADFAERRAELEKKVAAANANLEDIPSVRYLLNLGAKLEAESALMKDPVNPVNSMAKLVYDLAGRFARDGYRVQYAVFANLYMRQGEALKERLVFVPGRRTSTRARVSSYAPEKIEATVRPVLPPGWKSVPESRKVEVSPDEPVFADFQIECPARPAERNLLQLSVELPGRPAMITGFNDLEIVPALTVEAEPVAGALPDTPLTLTVRNRESAAVSGDAVVNTPDGNQELARFRIPELAPYKELKIPVKLAKITPEVAKVWRVAVRFKLDDGREFSVPADLDFVHASAAAKPPQIDSKLGEWSRAFPLRIDKAEYTRGSYGDGWTPEDCSAVSMLMWDRNYLYFAAEVKDQTFNQQFTGDSTWQQDSIQIIFADPAERKPFQINLALTPAGPQAWGDRLLAEAAVAIEYRDGKIHYEAAIPWSVFPGGLKRAAEKREFLYGIAVNDDDAIVPRRFLERFEGSIVHGKKVDSFARVTLGGEPPQAVDDGTVFEDDFSADAAGKAPLKWFYHRNNLPESSIRVVDAPDAKGGRALRLDNRTGNKPNHFAICIAELQLVPGAEYELSARVGNVPEGADSTIGVCADKWGNKSQSYMKLPPGAGWQTVRKLFRAPVNGSLNLIIRNTTAFDGMLIDSITVRRKK